MKRSVTPSSIISIAKKVAERSRMASTVEKTEGARGTPTPGRVVGPGEIKRSNPKDAVGTGKVPFSTVPAPVIAEIGLAMLEGARKYRRHNYRAIGVRASVYYDAAMRHLTAWWEGQDLDPDSGLHHIIKALSTLTVLRDAMLNAKVNDDRPPSMPNPDWVRGLNDKAKEIIARYPNELEPYVIEKPANRAGQN